MVIWPDAKNYFTKSIFHFSVKEFLTWSRYYAWTTKGFMSCLDD